MPVIEEVYEKARPVALRKGQHLRLSSNGLRTAIVQADRSALRRLLWTLLDNAIKYTPNGGTISVELNAMSSGQAVIEVRDTGPGIPATHRDRIFDRFYRVDASRSREEGGVGLGLAIARWAIEANGGRIELASDRTLGSLFRVLLPAVDNPSAQGKG